MLNDGLANSKQDNILFLFSSIFTLTKTDNNITLYSLNILQIPKHCTMLYFYCLMFLATVYRSRDENIEFGSSKIVEKLEVQSASPYNQLLAPL